MCHSVCLPASRDLFSERAGSRYSCIKEPSHCFWVPPSPSPGFSPGQKDGLSVGVLGRSRAAPPPVQVVCVGGILGFPLGDGDGMRSWLSTLVSRWPAQTWLHGGGGRASIYTNRIIGFPHPRLSFSFNLPIKRGFYLQT